MAAAAAGLSSSLFEAEEVVVRNRQARETMRMTTNKMDKRKLMR